MSHPYKSQARDNNPKWIKGLETVKEENKYLAADLAATNRNHITNPAVTALAAYEKPRKARAEGGSVKSTAGNATSTSTAGGKPPPEPLVIDPRGPLGSSLLKAKPRA